MFEYFIKIIADVAFIIPRIFDLLPTDSENRHVNSCKQVFESDQIFKEKFEKFSL